MLRIYKKLSGKGLSRYFPTNYFARKAVRNMTGDVKADVQGFKMIVPVEQDHGMVLYLKGIYEPAVTKFVKKFLHSGQTFVDVGACLGYYSLLASQIVGPKGRVLAFEPNEQNLIYLYRNVFFNNNKNIRIRCAAASDKMGLANLNISEHHIGCHSLLHSKLSGHKDKVQLVPTIPIDKCIDRIDMIKIDVEGWEYHVLKGMESFFAKNDNSIIVFMEHCPSLLEETNLIGDLADFLLHYAENIAIIDEKKKKLQFVQDEQIFTIKDRVNLVWWS